MDTENAGLRSVRKMIGSGPVHEEEGNHADG